MKFEEVKQLSDEEFMNLNKEIFVYEDFSEEDLWDEASCRVQKLLLNIIQSNPLILKWFKWNDVYFDNNVLHDALVHFIDGRLTDEF